MRYLRENYGRDKPYSEIVSITWSRSLRIQLSLFTPRRLLGPFCRSLSRLSRETSLTARSEKKRLLRRLQSHWQNHKAFLGLKRVNNANNSDNTDLHSFLASFSNSVFAEYPEKRFRLVAQRAGTTHRINHYPRRGNCSLPRRRF